MSEALEKKPLPADFPAVDTPANRVNIRKAMAGLFLLNGEGSMYRCAVKAGYSRATARRLNGLSAKDCVAEAAKLDERANPAKMLEVARARAMLSIESCDPSTVPLKDAMKMLDTVEKYYGGHALQPINATVTISDRLAGMVALLSLAAARGLPVPALPASYIDANVVSDATDNATGTQAPQEVAQTQANIPASDKIESVNLD